MAASRLAGGRGVRLGKLEQALAVFPGVSAARCLPGTISAQAGPGPRLALHSNVIAGGLGEGWRPEGGVRLQKRCTGVGQARPQGSRLTAQGAVRSPSLRVQLRHERSRVRRPPAHTGPRRLQLGQDGGHLAGTLPVRCNVQVTVGFQAHSQLCSKVLSDPWSRQTWFPSMRRLWQVDQPIRGLPVCGACHCQTMLPGLA